MQSVMLYAVWLSSLSVRLRTELYHQLRLCAKITGQPVALLFQTAHKKKKKASPDLLTVIPLTSLLF